MMVRDALPTAPSDGFREKPFVELAGERLRHLPLAPGVRRWLKRVYHGALMLQSGGRGLRCTLPGGEHLRALPEYRHISWNPSEYGAFRDAVLPGHVALDVGANVGAYALLLGQWVGPTGRVFAFEPAPDVHAALARHISLNRLDDIVRPVAAALSDRETEAPLVLSGTAGESRLAVPGDTGDVRSVSLTTIDRFCVREGLAPDFIKIDVEGWELSVLRGARDTIRSRGAALALFVELHPSIWPTLGLSRRDVEAELSAQDLELAPLTPGEDPWAVEGVAVRLRRRGGA
jgi:FkbM family methyltransferase